MNKKIVKINIYAGGAWDGHVVYRIAHPLTPEDYTAVGTIDSIGHFCEEKGLQMDEEFLDLVRQHLSYEQGKGLVIPIQYIDENQFLTSGSRYLKEKFGFYYLS